MLNIKLLPIVLNSLIIAKEHELLVSGLSNCYNFDWLQNRKIDLRNFEDYILKNCYNQEPKFTDNIFIEFDKIESEITNFHFYNF